MGVDPQKAPSQADQSTYIHEQEQQALLHSQQQQQQQHQQQHQAQFSSAPPQAAAQPNLSYTTIPTGQPARVYYATYQAPSGLDLTLPSFFIINTV